MTAREIVREIQALPFAEQVEVVHRAQDMLKRHTLTDPEFSALVQWFQAAGADTAEADALWERIVEALRGHPSHA